jgi:hypothetical protein
VYVFGYHGKLQEVMQILHDADVEVPFVMPENVYHFSRVCEKHGMSFGELVLTSQREGKELLSKDLPCIAFYHMNQKNKAGLDNFRVCVSGWEFTSAIRRTGLKEYVVALSDHSDFDGLMELFLEAESSKIDRSALGQTLIDASKVVCYVSAASRIVRVGLLIIETQVLVLSCAPHHFLSRLYAMSPTYPRAVNTVNHSSDGVSKKMSMTSIAATMNPQ